MSGRQPDVPQPRLIGVRRNLVTVVLVLLLLAVAGCGSHDASRGTPPSADPHSTTTSAAPVSSAPPTIPWWSHGRLHVGGRTIRTDDRRLVSRGGTTLIGSASGTHSHWSLVTAQGLRTLVDADTGYVDPVPSADGSHVAWVTDRILRRIDDFHTVMRFTVHDYDVEHGSAATTSMVSHVACCDASGAIQVGGTDDDGTVVLWRDYDRVWLWHPGHPGRAWETVRIADAERVGDPWPDGLTWGTTGDEYGPAAYGTVTAHGSLRRVGRLPQLGGGLWSPHGSAYAFTRFDKGGIQPIRVWRGGHTRRLRAPEGVQLVGWESPTSVIVVLGGAGDGDLYPSAQPVRCDVATGACAKAGPVLRGFEFASPDGRP
jgi:hypothetical protein